MEIIWQETENECGACAVAMLSNALHGGGVERAEAVLRANLSDGGMTIADLEALGLEFGVRIESYECAPQEVFALPAKRLHLALLRRGAGLHYACFSLDPKKRTATVYDSARGEYETDRAAFLAEYAGVVCTVEKADRPERAQKPRRLAVRDFASPGALAAQLILHGAFVALGIAGAQLLKTLLEGTVALGSVENLFAIIAPFAAMKAIEAISGATVGLLQTRAFRDACQRWWGEILRALPAHDFSFWKRRPHGTLFEVDAHLTRTAGFYCRGLADAAVSAATVLACAGALAAANPAFVAVGAAQIAFSALVLALKCAAQRRALPLALGQAQRHNALLARLAESVSRDSWRAEYEADAAAVRGNAAAAAAHAERCFWTASALDRAGDVAVFACGALAAGIGVSLAVAAGSLDVGDMLYALGLLAMLNGHAAKLVAAAFSFPEFRAAKKRLEGFAFPAAEDEGDGGEDGPAAAAAQKPLEITFSGVSLRDGAKTVLTGWSGTFSGLTALTGANGAGKSSLLKAITGRFAAVKGDIRVNGVPLAALGKEWLFENVVYLDGARGAAGGEAGLQACADSPEAVAFLRRTGLFATAPGARSAGQRQLARLAALHKSKGKVLLLDEPLGSVSHALRPLAFDALVAPLARDNLVVFTEHDERLARMSGRVVEVMGEGQG